jgi:hypothetical protein
VTGLDNRSLIPGKGIHFLSPYPDLVWHMLPVLPCHGTETCCSLDRFTESFFRGFSKALQAVSGIVS